MKTLLFAALVMACAHAATLTVTSVPSELLGNWAFVSYNCSNNCFAGASFNQSSNSSLEMSITTLNIPQCLENGQTHTFAINSTVANGTMASDSVSNFSLYGLEFSLSNSDDESTLMMLIPGNPLCQRIFTKTEAVTETVTVTAIMSVTEVVTSVPSQLLGNWVYDSSTCPNNCAGSVSFTQSSNLRLEMSTTTFNTSECLNGVTLTSSINYAVANDVIASNSFSNFTLTIDNSDLESEVQFSLSNADDNWTVVISDASNSCETAFTKY